MKFKITRHFGMYQFWHVDCKNIPGGGSPMHAPVELDNHVQQFKCVNCGQVGQVTLPIVTVGEGYLELISDVEVK